MRVESALRLLEDSFGRRFSRRPSDLEAHGCGEGLRRMMPPLAVVYPESTAEVENAVRVCAEHRLPVIPFGAGTSLEGHLQALHGGISLDLSRMDRILDVRPADLDCSVEAGVTREDLNLHLRDLGLFFPLDPGANATLGGMAATRASGTNAVRYGTMRDVVLGLTVVTPQGHAIRTGSRARKSASGYDLTRLYIGSEGTLGVITELHVRLFGIPEHIASGLCQFPDLESAVAAVTTVLQMGVPLARIELLDEVQMRASINYSKLADVDPKPTLFLEFHGSPRAVADQVEEVRAVFTQARGGALRWSSAPEDRRRLWQARHDAYWAGRALAPGTEALATDACVPLSGLGTNIRDAAAAARESGLQCPLVGHVGDGNFHLLILYDPARPGDTEKAEALAKTVARLAIASGGTFSGEHGVGLHRLDLLVEEHGAAVEVMSALKRALDPLDIMNPGKTVPVMTPLV